MEHYKLQKYQLKMNSDLAPEQKQIYQKKILLYGGAVTLQKPVKSDLTDYILDVSGNKVSAWGYGQVSKQTDLVPVAFDRRAAGIEDLIIEILYCGVCHSDWHSITGEWAATMPLVPGHEICGRIIKLGRNVTETEFAVGDAVLVGPYVNSCRQCARCESGNQEYCERGVSSTYDSFDRDLHQISLNYNKPTYGGFSNVITVNKDFVFKLPRNIPLDAAAPLMCAAVTVYTPLSQYVKPGMRVGITGIGGLGHMAVKIAKAMGAYVLAITTTKWKVSDAKTNLGADDAALVGSMNKFDGSLDLIIDTIPEEHNINIYLDLLAFRGRMCVVGFFDDTTVDMGILANKNCSLFSSIIGGVPEIKELLRFCSKHQIAADVELIAIKDINMTYQRLLDSDVKYRFVIDLSKK